MPSTNATKRELDQLAILKRIGVEIDQSIRQIIKKEGLSYEEVIHKYGNKYEQLALSFLKANNFISSND